LRSALAKEPSRASSRSQASKVAALKAAANQAWLRANAWEGNLPIPVLAGAHAVLDAGMRPVGGEGTDYEIG
jgi:hypothetical protein